MRTGLERGKYYCHFPFTDKISFAQHFHNAGHFCGMVNNNMLSTSICESGHSCKVFMLKLYKVITEAISVTIETPRL